MVSSTGAQAQLQANTQRDRTRRLYLGRWLWLGIVLAAILSALPYQFRHYSLDLGHEAATSRLSGFSFVEVGPEGVPFRWSEGEGTVAFSNTGNAPLCLRLYFHARRPSGTPTVTVSANGTEIASVQAGGSFQEHEFFVPRPASGWSGELAVSLRVEPFTAPPDTRSLGVALARVEVAPVAWPVLPPLPLLLPLLLAVAGLALYGRLLRFVPAITLAYATALGLGCLVLGEVVPLTAWNRLWLLPLIVWSVGAAIAWGPDVCRALARFLRRQSQAHPIGFWVVVMAAAAALIYTPLARTTGYWGDIEIYMAWTWQATHSGIHSVYSPDFVAPPNTTPVLIYPFRLAGEVFQRVWSPEFPPPWMDRTNQQYLRLLLRVPPLLAVLGITFAVYRYSRRRWSRQIALLAAAAYLFNPAVVMESAYVGQTGSVHGLFMFLAVIGLAEGRPALGWAALAVGMLTKPQADIFLPLFFLLTWKRYGFKALLRSGLAALITAAAILWPFIIHGAMGDMWRRISAIASYHPMLSATAHNVWWLFSLGQGKASDLLSPPFLAGTPLSFVNYRLIGIGLFGLAYLLVIARVWPDGKPKVTYLSFAYLFLSFFMLATQIHENHLIPMFPLLLLAAVEDRRLRWIYAALALTTTTNMILHYPDILRALVPQNPDVWGGAEMAIPRWVDSLFQVGIYLYWTVLFTREAVAGKRSTQ